MAVFLSPHFDDAVYSCGGTIARLLEEGQTVRVVTVMAGVPKHYPSSPIVRALHARWQAGDDPIATRRQEDEQAILGMGAQLTQLEAFDCVYRTHDGTALYPDEGALWGDIHPNDDARHALDSLWASLQGQTVYAPLGVGNHVDHRIVRDASLAYWAAHPRTFTLCLYTDYPYMRDEARVQDALAGLAHRLDERWQALDERHIVAKIAAMACYRSQISTFWQDEQAMAQEVRRMFRDRMGEYAERFWAIASP
jgi:LmbE family N-acetylglucosaminyl deacetylase